MYEKLFFNIANLLRGSVSFEDSLTFALQLLAWVRESHLARLPTSLRYWPYEPPRSIQEIEAIFRVLATLKIPQDNLRAFSYLPDSVRYLEPVDLLQLFKAIDQYDLTTPWSAVALADYVANLNSLRQAKGAGIAQEVADLMIAVASLEPEQEVYLPFEADLQLTYRAQQHASHTYSSSWHRTLLPWLLNLLSDSNAQVELGDELATPLFVQEGRLTQFDRVIALPPFGVRISEDLTHSDYYGRFPEPTTSLTVLAVRHITATTRQRAVIGVPNGLLFSPGSERSLRVHLLDNQVVEGVIALPPALLPGSAIQFSLLILNTSAPQKNVFFVDGTKPEFFEKDGKGRSVLRNWRMLGDLFLTRQPSPFTCLVATEEVLRNGTNLQPMRYCLDSELSATQALLATYQTAPLKSVVQFVRPAAMAEKNGTLPLLEISPSDFPEFGYLQQAGRTILTTEQHFAKAAGRKQLVQGHDVIIVMKGTVGKVALVEKAFKMDWAVGLACLVLRVDAQQLDARVLFVFLKSAAGQSLLKQIVSAGSTVPLIQLRDLEKLRIPIPTVQEQQAIIADFEQLVALEQEIGRLRKQQVMIAANFWTRPPVPSH